MGSTLQNGHPYAGRTHPEITRHPGTARRDTGTRNASLNRHFTHHEQGGRVYRTLAVGLILGATACGGSSKTSQTTADTTVTPVTDTTVVQTHTTTKTDTTMKTHHAP